MVRGDIQDKRSIFFFKRSILTFLLLFFIFFKRLYWSIIALQCCVSFNFLTSYLIFSTSFHTKEITNLQLKVFSPYIFLMQAYRALSRPLVVVFVTSAAKDTDLTNGGITPAHCVELRLAV